MPSRTHETSEPNAPPFSVHPNPPPPQPQGTTRFVLLSDTHGHPPPAHLLPPGDVLIHAGDLSRWGRADVLQGAIDWLMKLEQYPIKLVIAGNHDSLLDASLPSYLQPSTASQVAHFRSLLTSPAAVKAGIHYLEYSSYSFRVHPGGRTWKVWGSPGSPEYGSPAFQYPPSLASSIYAQIPQDVDILITHTPSLGMEGTLDRTSRGVHAGCPVLARAVRERGAWMHVFGHIHEGWGWEVRGLEEVERERQLMNVEKKREKLREWKDARRGGRGGRKGQAKRASAEIVEELERLSFPAGDSVNNPGGGAGNRQASGGDSKASSPKAHWRLSVNAALGRMGPNGSTSKGIRGPIIVDFWEDRMAAIENDETRPQEAGAEEVVLSQAAEPVAARLSPAHGMRWERGARNTALRPEEQSLWNEESRRAGDAAVEAR